MAKLLQDKDHVSAVMGWAAFIELAAGNPIPANQYREVYRDAEAFKLHWDSASMKTVRTEIGERMVKMTGVRCASA